ncbi:DUF72 domain-containing protein [Azospirillum sp. B4]|uniref:DUF72 domain-containing protein n=1 Tax=Azospirillum sp. B4 TaxID=95605 RepID=UPI00034AE994|nr:DUF72 domain-containing protein [Azospirillum sp. B4]
MAKQGRIRVGIGGWTYEPWRGTFYPDGLAQKRELEYASRQLSSIEINGTYYGSQKPESFAKWHDETPDDFVFSLKGPRFTTNRRVLAEAAESVRRFIDSGVLELKDKLGPINWQFMPTKKFDADDFGAFLSALPATVDGRTLRHAVEVRHDSFRAVEFAELARKHGVAVIHAADSDYPEIEVDTAPFSLRRIMGTTEGEEKGYSDAALDAWARKAKDWASGGKDVYLYVISGHKWRNPAAARALIERRG